MKRGIIIILTALSLLLSLGLVRLWMPASTTGGPLPALQGESALNHLKEQRLYGSLQEAVTEASYGFYQEPKRRGDWQAYNPAQRLGARLTPDGLQVVTEGDEGRARRLGMKLRSAGYGERQMAAKAVRLTASGARAEIHHELPQSHSPKSQSAIIEWYHNTAAGLEQGFTIESAPGERRDGERLRVALALEGELRVEAVESGQALEFKDSAGRRALRYDRLVVRDSAGRKLEARMAATEEGKVWLEVDDRDAVWPVIIDPTFTQQAQLHPSDGSAIAFGFSVAISGETVVVGSPDDNGLQGSAYIFARSGGVWALQQRLFASDAAPGDLFGLSVVISGDTVMVGAPQKDGAGVINRGSVYVFARSGGVWSQQQKLEASDPAISDLFGQSVAISGETVVVGSPLDDGAAGVDQGSAYIFVRNGAVWSQQQKLEAPDAGEVDNFGNSVAISGDTVMVGAPQKDGAGGPQQGSVYVFARSGGVWSQQQKLEALDAGEGDDFGNSVVISGDTVVVGAPFDDGAAGVLQGSAYVFARSGGVWSQRQKLEASDADQEGEFGLSVAISGATVVVGSRNDGAAGANQGSAYIFVRSSGGVWSQQQKLEASGAEEGDQFGFSVGISGGTVVVGAPFGNSPNSAYVFDQPPATATPVITAASVSRTSGLLAAIGDIAQVDDADGALNTLTVTVNGAASATVNGVTVSSIGVDASGQVTASVGADCSASDASFTLRVTDSSGLFAEATLDVTVAPGNNIAPVLSCPSDVVVILPPNSTDTGMVVNYPAPVATDNCTASPTITTSQASGTIFPVGVTTVNVTATDEENNQSTCSFTVTIRLPFNQQRKLEVLDGASGDFFGNSAAISGDTLVVGAHLDDGAGGNDQGSAYVFVRGSGGAWTMQQKLLALDGAANDRFGHSVAISGDTVVVGAPGDAGAAGPQQGSAYVFVRNGGIWTQQQKLEFSDPAQFDAFGFSVAISGDTVVVGSFADDGPLGGDQGSVHVFVRNGGVWTLQQKLLASDTAANDHFGMSVAINGETVVVGASGDSGPVGFAQGSAYVFVRSGGVWTQQQLLFASDAAVADNLGSSVAISGDTLVVGAPSDDGAGGIQQGSAYVFARNGGVWTQQKKLEASDPAAGDFFGRSLAISGGTIVVGSEGHDGAGGVAQGAAYVFAHSGGVWAQQQKLLASDAAAVDRLGSSVAISGDTVMVGAPGDSGVRRFSKGSVYMFTPAPPNTPPVITAASVTRTQGLPASIGAIAQVNDAEDALNTLTVTVNGAASATVNGATVSSISVDASGQVTASVGAICGGSFILRVTDSGGLFAEATLNVTVTPGAMSPVLTCPQKLEAPDASASDRFGSSVAISGETFVVGAPGDAGAAGINQGSVYVFVRNGGVWTLQQRLEASDPEANDGFGRSVAINGDTIVVGASGDDGRRGSAYVFVRSGGVWTQQQKLPNPDPAADDLFGQSVAISGETVVVGAQSDDGAAGANQGSAYVFARSGGAWSQQQKLEASDAAADDLFGASVAISGDTVVAGAQGDDGPASISQGSAYVFVRSDGVWSQQQKLPSSDPAAGNFFGLSVAISGETVVVGAFDDDGAQGAAYVFARNGGVWTQQQKLGAQDATAGDDFGRSVAISGETVVVGAPFDDGPAAINQGSAYVFARSGGVWSQQQKLGAQDAAANDLFGLSVAISGETVVVGAVTDDGAAGIDQGSVYVFVTTPANTPPAITAASVTRTQGFPASISAIAQINDVEDASNTLTVTVNGAASATVNGVTVSSIGVDESGQITASVGADCNASNTSFTLRVTDSGGLFAEDTLNVTVTRTQLTALSPAKVWVGLKNSDDVGTKFDLLAEVFKNETLIGSGQLDGVKGGSSGFNNAILNTIDLGLSGPVDVCPGDTLKIKLSVRIAANSGHRSGTARLWFNDAAANSSFGVTIDGLTNDRFLLDGFTLATGAGGGPKKTIDVLVDRAVGGNPFKPFGTWSKTF